LELLLLLLLLASELSGGAAARVEVLEMVRTKRVEKGEREEMRVEGRAKLVCGDTGGSGSLGAWA